MWYVIGILSLIIIVLCVVLYFAINKNKLSKLAGIENAIKEKEKELSMVEVDLVRSRKQLNEADEAIQEYLDAMEKGLDEVDTKLLNSLKRKFRK